MTAPGWTILVVIFGAFGFIVAMMARALVRAREAQRAWKKVVNGMSSFPYSYLAPLGITESMMREAVERAYEALSRVWPRPELAKAFTGAQVQVVSALKWQAPVCDAQGCRTTNVAGQSYVEMGLVMVGSDLAGLAHELAHLAEYKIDRAVDYDHATWGERGIAKAVESYAATDSQNP